MQPFKSKALLAIAISLLTAALLTTVTDSQKSKISDEETPGPGIVETSSLSRGRVSNTFEDRAGLYTVVLPESWKVVLSEGNKGVQRSFVTAESSDYREQRDETADAPFTPIYIESGAKLTIHVIDGEKIGAYDGEREEPNTVIGERSIIVDDVPGVFHMHQEPSIREGRILHAHFNYEGNDYLLTFSYNPHNFQSGEIVFGDILNTFNLKP